jgi:hypothetical protein
LIVLIALLSAALLLDVCLASYFKVVELQDVSLQKDSSAEFYVTIQNMNTPSSWAWVVFRDLPPGIVVEGADKPKWVFAGSKMRFNLTMNSSGATPGFYHARAGVYGKGTPYNFREFNITIEELSRRAAYKQTLPKELAEKLAIRKSIVDLNSTAGNSSGLNASPLEGAGAANTSTEKNSGKESIPAPGFFLSLLSLALCRRTFCRN